MEREGLGVLYTLVVGAALAAGQYLSASSDLSPQDVGEAAAAPVVSLVSNDPALTNPDTIATDGINLYVGTGSAIVSIPVTGGPARTLYASAAPGRVAGIARLGTDLFWIDPDGDGDATAIFKGSTAGGPIAMVYSALAADQLNVDGGDITSDGLCLYTTDYVQGQVHRTSDDDFTATFLAATFGGFSDTAHLSTIAADGGMLYVADSGLLPEVSAPQVFSLPAAGGPSVMLHSGAPFSHIIDIAAGGGFVYVADRHENTIWRMPAAGGPPTAIVAGGPFVAIAGIVYWNNALYVTDTGNAGTGDGPGAIYRIGLPLANEAPVADGQSLRTLQNTAVTVALSARDVEGDALTYRIVSTPKYGTLTGSAPNVTYTPAFEYAGVDSFAFEAHDGTTSSAAATVSIAVTRPTATTLASGRNPSSFGQPVAFTATITNGSQTPVTGHVEFFDGSRSLGVAQVGAGSATLTSSAVDAGTRTITAVYGGDQNNEASASPARTQTVYKSSTTTTLSLSPYTRHYSDRETFEATVTAANGAGEPPAESVTFKIGTQSIGTAPLLPSGTGYKARLADVPLLEPSPTGQLMPGTRIVTAVFNGVNGNYSVSNPLRTLGIYREDARVTYNGSKIVRTDGGGRKATIRLSAIVRDISATLEAAGDADSGDIRRATLAFVNRDTFATIAQVPVTLVDDNDTTTGTASYTWTVDIGSAKTKTFNVGLLVINYYNRNSTLDDVRITVSK
jgi:hypothetical protein